MQSDYEKESYIQEEGQAQSFSREKAAQPENMAWGRVEIPLSVNMKKGDICYSQEIMHGLDINPVFSDFPAAILRQFIGETLFFHMPKFHFKEKGVKEYIASPAQRRQQSLYLSYFREGYEKESYAQLI